jgi:hypothetical protein
VLNNDIEVKQLYDLISGLKITPVKQQMPKCFFERLRHNNFHGNSISVSNGSFRACNVKKAASMPVTRKQGGKVDEEHRMSALQKLMAHTPTPSGDLLTSLTWIDNPTMVGVIGFQVAGETALRKGRSLFAE